MRSKFTKSVLVLLLAFLFLVGCTSKEEREYVEKVYKGFLAAEKNMELALRNQDRIKSASWEVRSDYFFEYSWEVFFVRDYLSEEIEKGPTERTEQFRRDVVEFVQLILDTMSQMKTYYLYGEDEDFEKGEKMIREYRRQRDQLKEDYKSF